MANRVFIGDFDGEGDYRFRVSRPGLNVMDPALTGNDLAFDSSLPRFGKIIGSGTGLMTTSGNTGNYTVDFAVTYDEPPLAVVYFNDNAGRYILGNNITDGYGGIVYTTTSSLKISGAFIWRGLTSVWISKKLIYFTYFLLNNGD